MATEPAAADLSNPLKKYFLATRPPFLLASVVPCLIGLAVARHSGLGLDGFSAFLTVLGAVLFHAGANVLNDYYDALNGTDAINSERVFPFTGGSRFIQNGILSPLQTFHFGLALFAAGAVFGLILLLRSGPGLLAIGILGMLIGWAYSAPPLALNSRGLGEVSVAIAFGILIPLGTDYVQRGDFSRDVLSASLPYALLAASLLYVNQFPDRRADEAVGKRHWVVRLDIPSASRLYGVIIGLAYGSLITFVALQALPLSALLGLGALPLNVSAAASLTRNAAEPAKLTGAIRGTIGATLLSGVLITLGLLFA